MTLSLPTGLAAGVESALEVTVGRAVRIARAEPIHGGCVNPSACLIDGDGTRWFVKWNERAPAGMFDAEADGLAALAHARALRVPAVLGVSAGASSALQWLLLEYVAPGRPAPDYASRLGEGLAALHRARDPGPWGWERDNFIGRLPQSNAPTPGWGELWRDRRLAPQLALARRSGHFVGSSGALLDRLVERTPELLDDVDESPSLLHGDLWSGNVFADGDGRPVLIDPAVYRGHREVDLAMSEVFGGFPAGWPSAYDEAWPIADGYRERRLPLYQLYYLLVHVNLFGASYEAGCVSAARAAMSGM